MLKQRRFTVVSIIILLALLLAACSSSEQPQEATQPEVVEEEASQPAEETAEEEVAEEAVKEEAMEEEAMAEPITITLNRFFGSCEDEYAGVTDLSQAVGECGIMTVLLNKFNAENEKGITVDTRIVEWGQHYDQLNASFAGGEPPDVFIAHLSRLPNYVDRDLVAPLDDIFASSEVDTNDFVPFTRAGATYGGEIYGLPFDMHALLWHVNLDILEEAGLIDDAGNPILPSSPEELLEHAAQVKEATGVNYFALQSSEGELSLFTVSSLMAQQGSQFFDRDGNVMVDTPEALTAMNLVNSLYEGGHIDATQDYATAEQSFLNGEVAVLINGTWVVDAYSDAAQDSEVVLTNYQARAFPTILGQPGGWADTHLWAVSSDAGNDPAKAAAVGELLGYLYDNNFEWSRTGHLSTRQSVLSSDEFLSLPSRNNYVDTGLIETNSIPPIANFPAILDALRESVLPVWILGTTPEDALSSAQSQLEGLITGTGPQPDEVVEEEAVEEEAMAEPITITLNRFFGSCEDEYAGVTDLSQAVGECGIVTVLLNKFNAENDKGITVDTRIVEWGQHYDQLNASFAGGEPPDVFIAHLSRLPNYVDRDLVAPLDDIFAASEVDANDFVPFTRAGATYGEEIYGLPFDMHALLWHVNLDILAEAGLVDDAGDPILPSSPEELLEHAAQVKEATGVNYFALQSSEGELSLFTVSSLMAQQGSQFFDRDGNVMVDTPQALTAMNLVNSLYESGHIDATQDYATAEQSFLNGEVAVLINGTWVVDAYSDAAQDSEVALTNYQARAFPTILGQPGGWADTHLWAVSSDAGSDPAKAAAVGELLGYLYDNNFEWSRTGHLSTRQSVLSSDEFLSLPSRNNYVDTGLIETNSIPPIANFPAALDALRESILPVWILGTTPEDALTDAQSQLEGIFASN